MLWYITICGRGIDVNFLYKTRIWVIFTVTLIDAFMQVSIVYRIWSLTFFCYSVSRAFCFDLQMHAISIKRYLFPNYIFRLPDKFGKITILKLGKFSMVVFVVVKLVAFTITWNGLHRMFCLQLFFRFPFLFFKKNFRGRLLPNGCHTYLIGIRFRK